MIHYAGRLSFLAAAVAALALDTKASLLVAACTAGMALFEFWADGKLRISAEEQLRNRLDAVSKMCFEVAEATHHLRTALNAVECQAGERWQQTHSRLLALEKAKPDAKSPEVEDLRQRLDRIAFAVGVGHLVQRKAEGA